MARSFLTGAVVGALLLTGPQLAQAAPAGLIGRPAPAQSVNFTVHLPLRNESQLDQLLRLQTDEKSPLYQHYLTVAQFRATYAPSAASVAKATAALRARGFTVTGQTSQTLRLSGSTTNVERAFNTKLGIMREANGATRVASSTSVTVPDDLAAMGVAVTGFESRIHMHVNSRPVPANRRGSFGGYYFTDLKEAYTYPSDGALDGKGATIGVLMSSDVLDTDTKAQLDHEFYSKISGKTPPPLFRRAVLGGAPFAGIGSGASDEASIDVQTSQTSAPGAQIVLYNIPSLGDDAIMAGYTDIVEDNLVDVASSSFGGCELAYTAAYNNGVDYTGVLKAFDQLFKQGNSQGITFLASSGDEAGLECPSLSYFQGGANPTFVPSVGFPANDPNVTAVGGTNLQTTAPPSPQPTPPILTSKYVSENAYGDKDVPYDPYGFGVNVSGGYWGSGSGISTLWFKPWYQYLVNTPNVGHRSVPDISMQMGGCPGGIAQLPCNANDSFSIYYVDGSQYGFIGTSLSSPEFAGLLALKIQAGKSRLGNVNGYIYHLAAAQAKLPPGYPTKYYHQGIAGYNGVVKVAAGTPGYNPIVGVGTPYAQNFLGVSPLPLAGDPQTITNP